MSETNYKKLYKFCAEHLIEKKNSKEKFIFNKLVKNLKSKIENALIDEETHIVLYDDNFNKNIKNILPKLKKHITPFNITYRPKTLNEMSFIENICEQIPYILIIDWVNFAVELSENKLQTLFNKYINHIKISNIKNSFLLNKENIVENEYDSDNTVSSFDMMK
tara:strand:- start:304 stop:795 length:492 start_codon:yes stop_codon:yes gene_type:complete